MPVLNMHHKYDLTILVLTLEKGIFWKLFEREMFMIIQFTTLLQIFCEIMCISKVIFKSITYPDDNLQGWSLSMNGLNKSAQKHAHSRYRVAFLE